MKRPIIEIWDRLIIHAWKDDPKRFRCEPLAVTRYKFAHAKRDLGRAIMQTWLFKKILG